VDVRSIPVKAISRNPQQPRNRFDPDALRALADSIAAHGGVEQPITVTPNGGPDSYVLIDGERRWRAAQLAGLTHIDAVVKPKKSDRDMAESALIANLHRADLNAIEEARAYQNLIERGLKVLDVAQRTGKAVVVIYNKLQWLKLESEIQDLVESGKMQGDTRIATALLQLPAGETRIGLAQKLAQAGATIRAVLLACDRLAAQIKEAPGNKKHPMSQRARAKAGGEPPAAKTWSLDAIRVASRAMCAACEIKHDVLKGQVADPGWTLVLHAADQTCDACNVREVRGACDACPGVELLRSMIAMSRIKADLHANR
jgi:ParB family chromosome partitioning protein